MLWLYSNLCFLDKVYLFEVINIQDYVKFRKGTRFSEYDNELAMYAFKKYSNRLHSHIHELSISLMYCN